MTSRAVVVAVEAETGAGTKGRRSRHRLRVRLRPLAVRPVAKAVSVAETGAAVMPTGGAAMEAVEGMTVVAAAVAETSGARGRRESNPRRARALWKVATLRPGATGVISADPANARRTGPRIVVRNVPRNAGLTSVTVPRTSAEGGSPSLAKQESGGIATGAAIAAAANSQPRRDQSKRDRPGRPKAARLR